MKFYRKEILDTTNVLCNSIDCIKYAVSMKMKGRQTNITWIELSVGKYEAEFVQEVWDCVKVSDKH